MKATLTAVVLILLSISLAARKNILAVGNSMPFFNDMPKMLQAMCDESGSDYLVKQRTDPGVSLEHHLRYFLVADTGYWRMPLAGEIPPTIRILQSEHWDRVFFRSRRFVCSSPRWWS